MLSLDSNLKELLRAKYKISRSAQAFQITDEEYLLLKMKGMLTDNDLYVELPCHNFLKLLIELDIPEGDVVKYFITSQATIDDLISELIQLRKD